MRNVLRRLALSFPGLRRLREDRDRWRAKARRAAVRARRAKAELDGLRREHDALTIELGEARRELTEVDGPAVAHFVPPGHFYSPIPDLFEVRSQHDHLFDRSRRDLPGIDVNAAGQLAHLEDFERFYAEQPFTSQPQDGLRYSFDNIFFSYGDALALYAMLRYSAPRRVIEIGSGWSSALMLDVNDRFFDGSIEFTFVEPHPNRLHELFRDDDWDRATVIQGPVQSVADDVFAELGAGDLLFIDSTHVSKVGSDVNRLFLDVVPVLPPGVQVHVHDVFWPFEYPESWVYEGRSWTEDYLLRALLIGNLSLEISWFNAYLAQFHAKEVTDAMPLWAENPGGSIYLRTR